MVPEHPILLALLVLQDDVGDGDVVADVDEGHGLHPDCRTLALL
jgi:hypothetical protein